MFRECGARSRTNAYKPCRQPAISGKKRCRLHGGHSTGARTQEGIERIKKARTKHGFYSAKAIEERAAMRAFMNVVKNGL